MKRVFAILLFFIISNQSIFSQNSKIFSIGYGKFLPLKTNNADDYSEKINSKINSLFLQKNFNIKPYSSSSYDNLNLSKIDKMDIYYDGQYIIDEKNLTITIFVQLYNPENGLIFDSLKYSNDLSETLGDEFNYLKNKNREDINSVIDKISQMVFFSIISNPRKLEIRENIYDNLLSQRIANEKKIFISNEDKQKQSDQIFEFLGNEKVVTASRKSQKLSEAPAKVIVITSEIINQRGYRTLTDALQDIPYFDFNSFYDSGEYTTDFLLRGIGDVGQTQVLIMEDGIIQNDIGNGWIRHVQFDYSLNDVERIEIILGPGSALYGSNAYAGLINIITKKNSYDPTSSSKFKTDSRISYGYGNTKIVDSFNSYKFDNGLIFQLNSKYHLADGDKGLNRHDPGNYFSNNYEVDRITTNEYKTINNDKFPGGVRKKLNDGFNNSINNIFLRGKLIYENFTLGFNYWEAKEGLSSYVPGYEYFSNTKNIPFQKDHRGHYVYLSYNKEFNDSFSVNTKLYTRQTQIMPDTGFVYTYRYQSVDFPYLENPNFIPLPDKAKQYSGPSNLSGLQQQYNIKISPNNDLITGFQLDKTQIQSISDDGGGVSLGRRQNTNSNTVVSRWPDQKTINAQVFYSQLFAFYIQDEHRFFKKYSFTGGVRRDQESTYGNVVTTRLGLVGNPYQPLNFKILYGEAFKAPTVFQLYDEFRGNRFLKPQKIQTTEFEISYFINKDILLKSGYFISYLKDLIAEAANPNDGRFIIGPEGQYGTYFQNFKPTHIYGYSLESDFKLIRNLNLLMNYTFTGDRDPRNNYQFQVDQRGNIQKISLLNDGNEIDNIAAHKFNFILNYLLLDKLNINFRMNWVGKRKAPSTNYYFQPYDYNFKKYPYNTEGKPDGYASSYTLYNLVLTWKKLFGIDNLEPQIIMINLLDNRFLGMGRQTGNAIRPIDSFQPLIQNPDGFVSPYHPQPGRQIYLQLRYSF